MSSVIARAPGAQAVRKYPSRLARVILAAAAGLATGAQATPCGDDIAAMSQDEPLAARVAQIDPDSRRKLRELMEAAHILDELGRIEECRALVSAVASLAANRAAAVDMGADAAGASPEAGGPAPASAADASGSANTKLARASAEEGLAWSQYDYEASAARAEPFSEVADRVSSEMIVGAEARMEAGEGLGSVKGFLTDRLGVSHLIVGYGGFLGIGDRDVAVPVDQVSWDPLAGAFFIEAGPAWFEDQPDWDRADWSDDPDAWLRDD